MISKEPPITDTDLLDDDAYDEARETDLVEIDLDRGQGIVHYDSKTYAANLLWLAPNEMDTHDSVYNQAKEIGADFYCRRTLVPQNGFGFLKNGHRINMPSIAVLIADSLVGEWHGVFKVDNGWVYVAVHADIIAPEGDVFFNNENDAYKHFLEEDAKFKWPKKYVPDEWACAGNDGEIPIDKLLDTIANTSLKPANLDALFGSAAKKNMAILIGLAILGILVISITGKSVIEDIIPKPIQPELPISDISGQMIVPPKETLNTQNNRMSILDNIELPNGESTVVQCLSGFDDLTLSIPGWTLNKYRCRGNFVEAIWQRTIGNLDTLKSYINDFSFDVIKTYSSSGEFVASKILKNSNINNEKLSLNSRENIILALNNRFAKIGQLSISDKTGISQQSGRSIQSNPLQGLEPLKLDDLSYLDVIFVTKSSPADIKNNFNISGIKFNVVEWDFTSASWRYNFQIYIKPDTDQ